MSLDNLNPAQLTLDLAEASDLLMLAWGVIANTGGGNWDTQSEDWKHAAARWRDKWTEFNSYICSEYKGGKNGSTPISASSRGDR